MKKRSVAVVFFVLLILFSVSLSLTPFISEESYAFGVCCVANSCAAVGAPPGSYATTRPDCCCSAAQWNYQQTTGKCPDVPFYCEDTP